MGGGIAMALANAGLPVTLVDVSDEALQSGLDRVRANYATSVARGSTSQDKVDAALARIGTAIDYSAIGQCDLVNEAVFEDMALQREIKAEARRVGKGRV